MKKLSETYKELGIAFSLPIEIKDDYGNETYFEDSNCWYRWEFDADGNETYREDSDDFWQKWERDVNGAVTYFENSDDFWYKREYDADGNETYCETSNGYKRGTPKSAKTCEGIQRLVRKDDFNTWWNIIGSGLRPMSDEDMEEFAHRISFEAWQQRGLLVSAN